VPSGYGKIYCVSHFLQYVLIVLENNRLAAVDASIPQCACASACACLPTSHFMRVLAVHAVASATASRAVADEVGRCLPRFPGALARLVAEYSGPCITVSGRISYEGEHGTDSGGSCIGSSVVLTEMRLQGL
jgi:hypothetical protein